MIGSITIPAWLIYGGIGVAVVAVLGLAYVGFIFLKGFSGGIKF